LPLSAALNAASFRWDDMRYAASHILRSYLRSIPMHKQWNSEFNAFFACRHRKGPKTGEARECSGPSRSVMWTRFGVIYSLFESEHNPVRLHKDWWNHKSDWLWSRTSQKAVL
jgi:hypothetical protein